MADLQKPIRQIQQRIGEASRDILRVEAHIRRGEPRAARARIQKVRNDLQSLREHSDTPLQLAMIGAQMGLMSAGGSWLRGRVPAALVCGVGGWMYGHSMLLDYRREIDQLAEHVDFLHRQVDEAREADETRSQPAEG